MNAAGLLRISKEEEMLGLDVAECGGLAYQIPLAQDSGDVEKG